MFVFFLIQAKLPSDITPTIYPFYIEFNLTLSHYNKQREYTPLTPPINKKMNPERVIINHIMNHFSSTSKPRNHTSIPENRN